ATWVAFFFQAEDGMRDFHVTGVQTCAFPMPGLLRQRRGLTLNDYSAGWRRVTTARWPTWPTMATNAIHPTRWYPGLPGSFPSDWITCQHLITRNKCLLTGNEPTSLATPWGATTTN